MNDQLAALTNAFQHFGEHMRALSANVENLRYERVDYR